MAFRRKLRRAASWESEAPGSPPEEPPIAHNALKPKNILIEDVDPPLAKVTDIRKSPLSLSSNVPADVAATARLSAQRGGKDRRSASRVLCCVGHLRVRRHACTGLSACALTPRRGSGTQNLPASRSGFERKCSIAA